MRTITTKYKDSEGNIKSKRRAELKGTSVLYEGEYSETDSEAESEKNGTAGSVNHRRPKSKSSSSSGVGACSRENSDKLIRVAVDGPNGSGKLDFTRLADDFSMFRRQKLLEIPNIQLKPVKVTEFNEAIDENSDDDENASASAAAAATAATGGQKYAGSNTSGSNSSEPNSNGSAKQSPKHSSAAPDSPSIKLSKAEMEAKINDHLSINLNKSANLNSLTSDQRRATSSTGAGARSVGQEDLQNLISNENKEDEKSDIKVIDSTDEKTGMAIRTSIENKIKTNENVKVCKTDNVVDIKETDDAIVKKITTKTRTTKSVVKTTTTTTTKKGTSQSACVIKSVKHGVVFAACVLLLHE